MVASPGTLLGIELRGGHGRPGRTWALRLCWRRSGCRARTNTAGATVSEPLGSTLGLTIYTPELFDCLRASVSRVAPRSSLCHKAFVDYYYATREWCRLFLCVSDSGEVLGTLGLERMRFELDSREMILGSGSNYHAFEPGVGGVLYLQWMCSCPIALVFGGSEEAHKIYRAQNWTYFQGVRTYLLNYLPRTDDRGLRGALRWVRHLARRRPLLSTLGEARPVALASLAVEEEQTYGEDLLPKHSPFRFRFAPSVEHLAWRYATGLSFIRYRLFRIVEEKRTVGYVILNDAPGRLIVSHCDGEETASLAYGVLLALAAAARGDRRPREVLLASSHPAMQRIFEKVGFRPARPVRPLALGALRQAPHLASDPSSWLVNFDWGDNGLRRPFRDEEPGRDSGVGAEEAILG